MKKDNKIEDQLYDFCYEAWNWAEGGQYSTGSNYWMTMFRDKLLDCLNRLEPLTQEEFNEIIKEYILKKRLKKKDK